MTHTVIVLTQSHHIYTVCLADNHSRLLSARVSGKMMHAAAAPADYTTVGDRVVLVWDGLADHAVIHALEPRRSALGRVGDPATGARQLIAANLDVLILCMSLNQNFSLNRAERYIAAALAGSVQPVIVLTKADLCHDAAEKLHMAQAAFPGTTVLLNSAPDMPAAASITGLLKEGKTIAFAGSSGVGKSTLVNAVLGEEVMHTSAIREADGRGRHTTTHRELLFPSCGGAVIDTPGMRAFALDDADVNSVFTDLAELAAQCRFSDCTHSNEPGCAIRCALDQGLVDPRQVNSYIRLSREAARRSSFVKRRSRR